MRNTPTTPEADLQVDLQVGHSAENGSSAVSVVVNGIPSSADMNTVVAAILGSLEGALGVQLTLAPAHPMH